MIGSKVVGNLSLIGGYRYGQRGKGGGKTFPCAAAYGAYCQVCMFHEWQKRRLGAVKLNLARPYRRMVNHLRVGNDDLTADEIGGERGLTDRIENRNVVVGCRIAQIDEGVARCGPYAGA